MLAPLAPLIERALERLSLRMCPLALTAQLNPLIGRRSS